MQSLKLQLPKLQMCLCHIHGTQVNWNSQDLFTTFFPRVHNPKAFAHSRWVWHGHVCASLPHSQPQGKKICPYYKIKIPYYNFAPLNLLKIIFYILPECTILKYYFLNKIRTSDFVFLCKTNRVNSIILSYFVFTQTISSSCNTVN